MDIINGQIIHKLTMHDDALSSICFSPNGKNIVSIDYHDNILIWDIETGNSFLIKGQTDGGQSVCYSSNGKNIVIAGMNGNIQIINVTTRDIIYTIKAHDQPIRKVLYTPDGKKIISASDDGTIKFWKATTSKLVRTLNNNGSIWAIDSYQDMSITEKLQKLL